MCNMVLVFYLVSAPQDERIRSFVIHDSEAPKYLERTDLGVLIDVQNKKPFECRKVESND